MSNQIIKLQNDKRTNSINIKTEDWYGYLSGGELGDGLTLIFGRVLLTKPELYENWMENKSSLENLTELIKEGFKVKVVEVKDSYVLVVAKDKCSINFTVRKTEGIAKLFENAEDWAATMLDELGNNKNI